MRVKTVLFLLLALVMPMSVVAQELKVDKVTLLDGDNSATDNPRYDNNRQPCAMLKVYVNDLPDLLFNSSYVIDKKNIKYEGGYYAVYVAAGVRKLEVRHSDYSPVTIKFKDDFGISVKGGKTYRVDLLTEGLAQKQTQTVVFDIRPRKANIVVDNESHEVDNGIVQLELAPGEHTFKITADYYHEASGKVEVTDISESKIVKSRLKAHMAEVNFTCNVPNGILFVDNVEKGIVPGKKTLPMGSHKIRIMAEDCVDYTKTVLVDQENGFGINVEMQPKKVISVVVQTKNFNESNLELYVDNKEVSSWKNGGTIKVKRGKHLITVSDSKYTKEKVCNIQLETDVITINAY